MLKKSASATFILLVCITTGSVFCAGIQLPVFRPTKDNTLQNYMGMQACPPTSNNPNCVTPIFPESTTESNLPTSDPSNPTSPEEPGRNPQATQTAERKSLLETLQAPASATITPEPSPPNQEGTETIAVTNKEEIESSPPLQTDDIPFTPSTDGDDPTITPYAAILIGVFIFIILVAALFTFLAGNKGGHS